MEINKSRYLNIKKKTWYDEVKNVSDKMNEPIGKWLSTFKGWKQEDVYKVIDSAEKLSQDCKIKFQIALNYHLKEIKKSLYDSVDK